jgi:hypothetical protein
VKTASNSEYHANAILAVPERPELRAILEFLSRRNGTNLQVIESDYQLPSPRDISHGNVSTS